MAGTSMNLTDDVLKLLRRVANARQERDGNRSSISLLVNELVEKARPDLEKEVEVYANSLKGL